MQEILVVDDDCDNLSLITQILELDGIRAVCATSAEIALVSLEEKTFRLMITDRNMPGLDGFDLAIKAAVIAPLMPIIMMTGDFSPAIPCLAEAAGIVLVLEKPFHPDELLKAIMGVLGNVRERIS